MKRLSKLLALTLTGVMALTLLAFVTLLYQTVLPLPLSFTAQQSKTSVLPISRSR